MIIFLISFFALLCLVGLSNSVVIFLSYFIVGDSCHHCHHCRHCHRSRGGED